jgi:hypothetical protein
MRGARRRDHKTAAAPAAALSAAVEIQRRYAEATMRATQGLSEGAASSAETLADFMRERLDEELAAVSDLAACKSPLEACAVCNAAWLSAWSAGLGYWSALGQGTLDMMRSASDAVIAPEAAKPSPAAQSRHPDREAEPS